MVLLQLLMHVFQSSSCQDLLAMESNSFEGNFLLHLGLLLCEELPLYCLTTLLFFLCAFMLWAVLLQRTALRTIEPRCSCCLLS